MAEIADLQALERIALGEIEKRVLGVAEPVLRALGYDIAHLEVIGGTQGGRTVRFYIDKPEGAAISDDAPAPPDGEPTPIGVTIDDCVRASRELDVVLDVAEVLTGAYVLEVSSPGLDRPLGRRCDFVRFAGQTVRLETTTPIAGRRRYAGPMKGCQGADVLIEVDGKVHAVPFALIKKAVLRFDFNEQATKHGAPKAKPKRPAPPHSDPEPAPSKGQGTRK